MATNHDHDRGLCIDTDTDTDLASRFIDALAALERDRRFDPLVKLFARDAVLVRLDHVPERGRQGARQFWTDYRDMFEEIESRFIRSSSTKELVMLEWVGTGSLRSGRPIRYTGASILEVTEGQVSAFRTYYDTAAFLIDTVSVAH